MTFLGFEGHTQVVVGVGLVGLVAEFFEQAQGVLQVGVSLVEAADPGTGLTDS